MKIIKSAFKALRMPPKEVGTPKENQNYYYEITPFAFGKNDKTNDTIKVKIRIASHCVEKDTRKEVFGYLTESDYILSVEDEVSDRIEILLVLEHAFCQHEDHFANSLPTGLEEGSLIDDDVDRNKIIEGIFHQAKALGYYV